MAFRNQGSNEASLNDMFLLIRNNVAFPSSDLVCYQYGGYDYAVSA